jgi:hypothetical protein
MNVSGAELGSRLCAAPTTEIAKVPYCSDTVAYVSTPSSSAPGMFDGFPLVIKNKGLVSAAK